MFGYLRPMQGELKVYELERFKACYCGLCRGLGKQYGVAARFVLSYELVFLSMLLWDKDETIEIKSGRCMAGPFRKKKYCAANTAISACAGYNVILSWWKLRDTISDEPFFKSLPHRALCLLLRGAYKKASREYADFDGAAGKYLSMLSGYEKGEKTTLDGAADKFALILRSVADSVAPESTKRAMSEMLYHIGRWIYIIDACDDYEGDVSANQYNPIASRFPPEQGRLPDSGKDRIATTLSHSNNLICSAFELLPENIWTQTVRNIIYLGMPDVCSRVMEGKYDL